MSKTKGDLVRAAFRKARISGITTQPTGDELAGGVETLEDMMLELRGRNACTDYNFEDSPDLSTDSRLDSQWYHAVQSRLAVLLCSDFGIEPGATLRAQSRQAWAAMIGSLTKPKQLGQPDRMPRGSGNMLRNPHWRRYYHSTTGAPIDCSTIKIKVGETFPLTIDFGGFLNAGETIQSYTIKEVTDGITVTQDVLAADAEGVEVIVMGKENGANYVVIEITTSIGRIYPEKVWFSVEDV